MFDDTMRAGTVTRTMLDQIHFEGHQLTAHDLVAKSTRTSWPEVYSTAVAGGLLRWQYANKNGPCRKEAADRIVVPFAHAGIPKGTELILETLPDR